MVIEICANSAQSSIEAQRGGAQRIELCAGIPEGGTTPSWGEMNVTRRSIDIRMNVIIRPRGGDFLYTDEEFEAMKLDIQAARQAGADGVVFGCLESDGSIDMSRNGELMSLCKGLSTTFHRAFDVCSNPLQALEQIIELGFDRILTSGCCATALEGAQFIRQLILRADGRIIIMPGCGVNEQNIAQLAQITGAREFHSSSRSRIDSLMSYRNHAVSMGGTLQIEEFAREVTSHEKVAKLMAKLNGKIV